MKSHSLPSSVKCPACGTVLDGSINTTCDVQPHDGDPSICCHCRALLVFSGTPVNSLRYPTDDEQRRYLADPQIQRVIAVIGEAHRTGILR